MSRTRPAAPFCLRLIGKRRPNDNRLVMFTPGHSDFGGIARRSRLLASGLSAQGWDVRVIAKSDVLCRFTLERRPNLTVLQIPGFRSRLLAAVLYMLVGVPVGVIWGRRAAAFLAVQLVSPATAAAVASLVTRRPYLAFSSTSGQLSEAAYLRSARFAGIRRALIRRAAFLLAQTPAAAEELKTIAEPSRVVVVPNPVEAAVAPGLSGRPSVLYTGRLSEEKDLLRLLDAWSVVVADRPEAVLTLAGDGGLYRPVETDLRRRVADDHRLRQSVVFTGWVPDVRPLLAQSDVYAFPSLTEGMSNSLLEACAWSRVVVASDIPSNRAVLGDDYPLLFVAGNTESLVAALERALDDDSTRRQSVGCISTRMSRFSASTVVDMVDALIRRAAERKTTFTQSSG